MNGNIKAKFLKTFFITIGISLIGVFISFFIYKMLNKSPAYDASKQRDSTIVSDKEIQAEEDSKSKGFLKAPVRTNVLITGVDRDNVRTDVIMVASYISTTGQINLLSIPRDTYINFTGKKLEELRKINKGAPSVMKATEIYSYTGKKAGIDFLEKTLEELLEINIDYNVVVNLDAFIKMVDAIGGVYFTVPEGGLKYSDPTQNLYINLKGGYQLLNGKDAEGLVRFRKGKGKGYARGDLKRVEVQQEFIKEVIKQTLKKENIMSNLGELAVTFIKYVKTNFSLADFPKYITSVKNINSENIKTATAPGVPQMINGISFYLIDKAQLKPIVDEFFYGSTDLTEQTTQENAELISETTSKANIEKNTNK